MFHIRNVKCQENFGVPYIPPPPSILQVFVINWLFSGYFNALVFGLMLSSTVD